MGSSTDTAPGLFDLKAMVTVESFVRLFVLWVAYRLLAALYNISPLHPLSRFPGPKLAAMTIAYEGWYDLIKVGRYTSEIQKMHEKYGVCTPREPNPQENQELDSKSQRTLVQT